MVKKCFLVHEMLVIEERLPFPLMLCGKLTYLNVFIYQEEFSFAEIGKHWNQGTAIFQGSNTPLCVPNNSKNNAFIFIYFYFSSLITTSDKTVKKQHP